MKFTIFLLFIFIVGCVNKNIQKAESFSHLIPETVPGTSIANDSDRFMSNFYDLLIEGTNKHNNCATPVVINAEIIEISPWDTSKNPPILTGTIKEQWDVNSCGSQMGFIFMVKPVKDDSGRLVIGGANWVKE